MSATKVDPHDILIAPLVTEKSTMIREAHNQIAFRVENVRAFLRVVLLFPPGTARDTYTDQVQQWIALEAGRIRDVLHGTPVASPTP